jgi:hypothetical protein
MTIIKRDTDFNKFQKHFKEYQDKFGLNGYRVYFKQEQIDGFADIERNQEGMVATVRLNNKLNKDDKKFCNMHDNAKHEAIHLLLSRISELSYSRFISKDELYSAEEELVRRLEQLIPDIKHK